jgi:hypothetical protein
MLVTQLAEQTRRLELMHESRLETRRTSQKSAEQTRVETRRTLKFNCPANSLLSKLLVV